MKPETSTNTADANRVGSTGGSALDAENQRIASEAAEFIHRELSDLKGPWVVHEQSFLPANVECDHGGRCHFDAILARHVLAAIRKSQVYLPNKADMPSGKP